MNCRAWPDYGFRWTLCRYDFMFYRVCEDFDEFFEDQITCGTQIKLWLLIFLDEIFWISSKFDECFGERKWTCRFRPRGRLYYILDQSVKTWWRMPRIISVWILMWFLIQISFNILSASFLLFQEMIPNGNEILSFDFSISWLK